MAQQTLLQMTQDILNHMSSDEVNSISDTTESLQVATIIKNKYYDIISRGDLSQQDELFQFDPSNDSSKPTLMFIPAGVQRVEWVKYFDSNPNDSQQVSQFGAFSHNLNTDIASTQSWTTTSSTSNTIGTGSKTFTVASSSLPVTVGQGVSIASGTNSMFGNVTSYIGTTMVINVSSTVGSGTLTSWTITTSPGGNIPGYKYVTILPIDQFLDTINRFNPSDSNVLSYTFTDGSKSFTFYYKNNVQPQFCTVLSNYHVIFDSYDNTQDSTLQSSKTLVFGNVITPFQMVDSFIPDLDDEQFPLLLNEAKVLAFFELKQMPHQLADREVKRQWVSEQKKKNVVNRPTDFDQLSNFGRVPRTGGFSSGGYGAYRWMRQSGP